MLAKLVATNDVISLISYLSGPGRANEHTNVHVVSASDDFCLYPGQVLTDKDYKDIANQMKETYELYGRNKTVKLPSHTGGDDVPAKYAHLIISLPINDGVLDEKVWNEVVKKHMQAVGLDKSEYIAIRHGLSVAGNDHVHVVAQVVQTEDESFDGSYAGIWNCFQWKKKLRATSDALEEKYGLTKARSVNKGYSPVQAYYSDYKKLMPGTNLTIREYLSQEVREASMCASTDHEFVSYIARNNIIVIPRCAKGDKDSVVGCSFQLQGDKLRYAGSKLARDCSLPAIRARLKSNNPDYKPSNSKQWYMASKQWGEIPAEYNHYQFMQALNKQILNINNYIKQSDIDYELMSNWCSQASTLCYQIAKYGYIDDKQHYYELARQFSKLSQISQTKVITRSPIATMTPRLLSHFAMSAARSKNQDKQAVIVVLCFITAGVYLVDKLAKHFYNSQLIPQGSVQAINAHMNHVMQDINKQLGGSGYELKPLNVGRQNEITLVGLKIDDVVTKEQQDLLENVLATNKTFNYVQQQHNIELEKPTKYVLNTD